MLQRMYTIKDFSWYYSAIIIYDKISNNSSISSNTQLMFKFQLSQNEIFTVGMSKSGTKQEPHIVSDWSISLYLT